MTSSQHPSRGGRPTPHTHVTHDAVAALAATRGADPGVMPVPVARAMADQCRSADRWAATQLYDPESLRWYAAVFEAMAAWFTDVASERADMAATTVDDVERFLRDRANPEEGAT